MKRAFATAALAMMSIGARGQDTRTVTEPVIPPVCATLKAQLGGPIGAADEGKLDTERIQKGFDGCGAGKALELAADGASHAFLSGPLELREGVTLLIDKGVTLYGSRDPKVYEVSPGSCGVVSEEKSGCRPLISGKHVAHAAIMGDGVIDGRGGARLLVDGKEKGKTWWDLAEDARNGGRQQVPRLIVMDHSDDFTLYRITLKNSANFHVSYAYGDGFTVWGLKIDTPKNARNTDGVDPSASKNITVTQSYIRDGDDTIAIKIRIKSQQAYGGLVHDIVYDDLCIRNSKSPIQLDTNYSANPKPGQGLIPVFQDIVLRDVRISGGGKIQLNGFDATHRIGIQFDGVTVDSPSSYKYAIDHADIVLGPGPVNLTLSGQDSTVRGTPGKGSLASCAAKFVTFPE
jgi:polygalacturonase